MKRLFLFLLLAAFTSPCYSQAGTGDYCHFLELIFNNDSCRKHLMIDNVYLDTVVISNDEPSLKNCNGININGKFVPIKLIVPISKKDDFFGIKITIQDDGQPLVVIGNSLKHRIISVFFSVKNGKWVILRYKAGII